MTTQIYRPTADGNLIDWTPSAGTTRWDKVDEATANGDTDYIYKGAYTPDGIPTSTFFHGGIGAEIPDTDVINFIKVYSTGKAITGNTSIGHYVSIDFVAYGQTAGSYTTLGYDEISATWTTNPATGQAWTKAVLNGDFEFGVGKITGVNTARCTQIYLLVDHSPPAGNVKKINIGDAWKDIAGIKINIGDVWKTVAGMKINIGDAWKTIF